MQIKSYNKEQLKEFINSDFFRVLNKIPISFQRALSQIKNPYCSNDDILLWAAYEKASLIGYVGVLPDIIIKNNLNQKFYWLSCFWVDENYRNENLASQLFFPLIKQYKNQLFISNFLFSLEKTYQGLGIFQPTQYIYGNTFYVKFCFSDIIKARFQEIKPIMPFYNILEFSLNRILNIRKLFYKYKKRNLEKVENFLPDDNLQSFLSNYSVDNDNLIRSTGHFEWIRTSPWILPGKSDSESERYFFSSKAEQFEYRFLKLNIKGKQEGFALLKIRDKNLTISYLYTSNDCIDNLAEYLIKLTYTEDINTITTFDNRLTKTLKNKKSNFIYIKNTKRPYIFPKNFDIKASVFQDGDGDSIFT